MKTKKLLSVNKFIRCFSSLCGLIGAVALVLAYEPVTQGQTIETYIGLTNLTSTNISWTCPANVYSVQVEATGGGGGGGGTATTPNYSEAGGGAGGSYVRYTVNITPGNVYNFTVAGGGAGGTTAGGLGSQGGASYFGNSTPGNPSDAVVFAVGGPGGAGNVSPVLLAAGTQGNNTGGALGGLWSTNGNLPSVGAAANFKGTDGGISIGGGLGSLSGPGGTGAGASGSSGGGAGGAGIYQNNTSTAGKAGTAPGGGGSGANVAKSGKVGGNGGAGQIVLTYTVNVDIAGNSTVVASPTSVAADGTTTSTITVTLQDASANPISGKTVTLASSRGVADTIFPASVITSASGVATFSVKSAVGGAAILTATDTTDSITITQTATVNFISSVNIDHFTVTPSVISTNAGQVFTATVQAYTSSGPITDNSADGITVLMISSGAAQFDGNGDGNYDDNLKALTNGNFTINVRDLKAETITLTASVGASTGTSGNVNITPGTFSQLQLLLPGEAAAPGTMDGKTGTPADQTAGNAFSVTVNAVDANWNIVATNDVMSLAAENDANAVLPANTALSGGMATLTLTNSLAGGDKTLTASDASNGGITPSTSSIYSVVPGAVARLVILAPGESSTFGVAPGKTGSPSAQNSTVGYSVTVTALDANYNLCTNCADTGGVNSSAGGDTLPSNSALVGGTQSFSLTNNTVGSAVLTATDVSNGSVISGTSTVPVNINSTTTTVISSANPANTGAPITFIATISGAGIRTGTVTFKNGTEILGTSTLAVNTATLTLSGGSGTYSITAVYSGDANNNGSTSAVLQQVIQTGGAVVGPAALVEDGQDYPLQSSTPAPPNRGPWQLGVAAGSFTSTSYIQIVAGELFGATTPDIKPLPNQTTTPPTNPPAKLQVAAPAANGRFYYRSFSNNVTSGSVYFSFLLNVTVNPTTTNEFMGSIIAGGATNGVMPTDPLTFHARQGADNSHFDMGIERLGGTPSWTGDLADNTTYLVVLKYTFGPSATCDLFINPTPGGGEPTPTASATSDGITPEPASIGTVEFYMCLVGAATYGTTGTYQYDVMRADNNWANVTPSINSSSSLGAASLAFTSAPQTITANSNSGLITVTLLDQSNDVFTATSDTVVSLGTSSSYGKFLSGIDGTTIISDVTISNGSSTATFYYNDGNPGNPTITGSSGLLTPAAQTENVNPAPGLIDHLTVTPSLNSTTVGAGFTATVQAFNSSNVAITDSSLNGFLVTMTSSGLAQFDANADGIYGDNVKALTNGTFTINVRDLKAENITLTATLGTLGATSSSINIGAGAAVQLQMLLPGETATPGVAPGKTGTPSARTAGIGYNITVNAVDSNWNVAASGDTVHIAAANDANAILPANTVLIGGTATLAVTNIIAGSGRTLTASDVSNGAITSSTSSAYLVIPGNAVRLIVMAPGESATYSVAPGKTGAPSHQIQTGSYNLTVNALDTYYNLATNNSDTVNITSTDGLATLPPDAALVGGVQTFAVVNNTYGTITDTAADVSNGSIASGSTTLPVDIIERYRTMQSGNWSDTNIWQYSADGGSTWTPAVTTPSSALTALVEITNGITVTVSNNVTANRTTVDVGGTVAVAPGVTLSVADAGGNDLHVYGNLNNAGTITDLSPATVNMHSGATYFHNQDGGSIMTATWDPNSTCDVIGWKTTTAVTAATGLKQTFGNFTWNSPSQTATLSFSASTPTNFAGNFNVVSTGSGVLQLSTSGALNLIVGGNVNISGGTLYGLSTTAQEAVNVGGSINVSGGTFNLNPSITGGIATWNVSGNVDVTGGTLTASGTNNTTINFVNSGTKTLTVNGSGIIPSTSTIVWNVASDSIVDLGTSVVNGVGSFTLSSGGGLITANSAGLTGNLNLPVANVTLISAGNYTYDGVTAQSGDTLLPAIVSSLTVNNNQGLVLNQTETITNLNLNGSQLTGNISIADSGTFTVTGANSMIVGNIAMNSSLLDLVPSGLQPALTIQGGTFSMNSGGVTLTVPGSPLSQGSYLLVDANSGGAVSGSVTNLATVNGNGLLTALSGIPQITDGKLVLNVVAFYQGYDAGAGLTGENIILTNRSGMNYYVWYSSSPTVLLSNWNLEGQMMETAFGGSGISRYSINVDPVVSPTYYVVGTTNGGPYGLSPVPIIILAGNDDDGFILTPVDVGIGGTGSLSLTPTFILPGHFITGNAFQLEFAGITAFGYTVWGSTNLTSWTIMGTGTFDNTPATFIDTSATNNAKRFYRISTP